MRIHWPIALTLALTLSACASATPTLCPPEAGKPASVLPAVVGGQARLSLSWLNPGATAPLTEEGPAVGAEVYLADAETLALPGVHATVSADGQFTVHGAPQGYTVVVVARAKTPDGKVVKLRTLARPGERGATADINVATTVLTAALTEDLKGMLGDFSPEQFKQAVAKVYEKLRTVTTLDLRDNAAMIALFKSWSQADGELLALYTSLRASLMTAAPSLAEVTLQLDRVNGQVPAPVIAQAPSPRPSTIIPATESSPGASPSPPVGPMLLRGQVATWVGNDRRGRVDGNATDAEFNTMGGLTVDNLGAVYLADTGNHAIRKIMPDGKVTTLAGSGAAGYADGAPGSARFSGPEDVAVDTLGNVYVADTAGHRLRRISPDGTVSTLAGTGTAGTSDGPGRAVQLDGPIGLALSPDGRSLYFSEYGSHTIRRVDLTNDEHPVTTIAGVAHSPGFGDGPGATARFNQPISLAVDTTGNVYVADSLNSVIRRVAPDGAVTTFAGLFEEGDPPGSGYAEGNAAAARFSRPRGLAFDPRGQLIVADTRNQRIRAVVLDGTTRLIAGSGAQGLLDSEGNTATFHDPGRVAVGPDGTVYVSDFANNRVRWVR